MRFTNNDVCECVWCPVTQGRDRGDPVGWGPGHLHGTDAGGTCGMGSQETKGPGDRATPGQGTQGTPSMSSQPALLPSCSILALPLVAWGGGEGVGSIAPLQGGPCTMGGVGGNSSSAQRDITPLGLSVSPEPPRVSPYPPSLSP